MDAASYMEQVTLPALMTAHERAMEFLQRNAQKAGLESKCLGRLRLAVDEMVTNIIKHGYGEQNPSGILTMEARSTPETFVITLEDAAPPFDPRNRPEPQSLNDSVETRPIGGLGIYLTMKSVDHFAYEYVNGKNRNILVMKKEPGRTCCPDESAT